VNSTLKAFVLAIVLLVLSAFLVACLSAVRKSRALQARYAAASREERVALEARAQLEPELAAYMYALPGWQVVVTLVLVATIMWAKFTGHI
jgi:heme/copper-type cytochrome/quinol oxidase subunit 2